MDYLTCFAFGAMIGAFALQHFRPAPPEPDREKEKFASSITESMRRLKANRQFVGDGVELSHHQTWAVGGLGTFILTIEEDWEDEE